MLECLTTVQRPEVVTILEGKGRLRSIWAGARGGYRYGQPSIPVGKLITHTSWEAPHQAHSPGRARDSENQATTEQDQTGTVINAP